ncbi:MAG: hypothetical protein JRH20_07270 [Deltaproteobacteria bacterium]|nr:hypothetical protein [Deltaproteobacteria bacterium]
MTDTALPDVARLSRFRIALVILAGVVLPIVSVIVNHAVPVVDLGLLGVLLCIASATGVLLNLLLLRRMRRKNTKEVLVDAPRSTLLLALLLVSSALSITWWGYLSLLFLPMLPLSLIAVIFMGIGFCGLCPFLVTAISVVQAVRAARVLRLRLSRRWVVLAIVAPPVIVVTLAVSFTFVGNMQRRHLLQDITAITKQPAFSAQRMSAIAALRGRETLLLERITREHDAPRREAMAEAYERLTDEPATVPLRRRVQWRHHRNFPIRPFFFTQDESPIGFKLTGPFGNFFGM